MKLQALIVGSTLITTLSCASNMDLRADSPASDMAPSAPAPDPDAATTSSQATAPQPAREEALMLPLQSEPHVREDLAGLSASEITNRLGSPAARSELELAPGMRLREYQGSLYAVAPTEGSVTVEEITWKRDGQTLKVWLWQRDGRWESFDSLAWSSDTRF